jgi:hypothetical protein
MDARRNPQLKMMIVLSTKRSIMKEEEYKERYGP